METLLPDTASSINTPTSTTGGPSTHSVNHVTQSSVLVHHESSNDKVRIDLRFVMNSLREFKAKIAEELELDESTIIIYYMDSPESRIKITGDGSLADSLNETRTFIVHGVPKSQIAQVHLQQQLQQQQFNNNGNGMGSRSLSSSPSMTPSVGTGIGTGGVSGKGSNGGKGGNFFKSFFGRSKSQSNLKGDLNGIPTSLPPAPTPALPVPSVSPVPVPSIPNHLIHGGNGINNNNGQVHFNTNPNVNVGVPLTRELNNGQVNNGTRDLQPQQPSIQNQNRDLPPTIGGGSGGAGSSSITQRDVVVPPVRTTSTTDNSNTTTATVPPPVTLTKTPFIVKVNYEGTVYAIDVPDVSLEALGEQLCKQFGWTKEDLSAIQLTHENIIVSSSIYLEYAMELWKRERKAMEFLVKRKEMPVRPLLSNNLNLGGGSGTAAGGGAGIGGLNSLVVVGGGDATGGKEVEKEVADGEENGEGVSDVMISYERQVTYVFTNIHWFYLFVCGITRWTSGKALAKRIKQELETRGLRVWFDEEEMRANMYERMAEAVAQSKVITPILTAKYSKSPNCKRELSYAADLKKHIEPTHALGDGEKLDRWVSLVTAGIIYYSFDKNAEDQAKFQESMTALYTSIRKYLDDLEEERRKVERKKSKKSKGRKGEEGRSYRQGAVSKEDDDVEFSRVGRNSNINSRARYDRGGYDSKDDEEDDLDSSDDNDQVEKLSEDDDDDNESVYPEDKKEQVPVFNTTYAPPPPPPGAYYMSSQQQQQQSTIPRPTRPSTAITLQSQPQPGPFEAPSTMPRPPRPSTAIVSQSQPQDELDLEAPSRPTRPSTAIVSQPQPQSQVESESENPYAYSYEPEQKSSYPGDGYGYGYGGYGKKNEDGAVAGAATGRYNTGGIQEVQMGGVQELNTAMPYERKKKSSFGFFDRFKRSKSKPPPLPTPPQQSRYGSRFDHVAYSPPPSQMGMDSYPQMQYGSAETYGGGYQYLDFEGYSSPSYGAIPPPPPASSQETYGPPIPMPGSMPMPMSSPGPSSFEGAAPPPPPSYSGPLRGSARPLGDGDEKRGARRSGARAGAGDKKTKSKRHRKVVVDDDDDDDDAGDEEDNEDELGVLFGGLKAVDFEDDKKEVMEQFVEGTRGWVLDVVREWVKDSEGSETISKRLFWINGGAGFGKTMIAVLASAQLSDICDLGSIFFCKHDYDNQNSSKQILTTIAHDLAKAIPSFKAFLEREALQHEKTDDVDILTTITTGLNLIRRPEKNVLIVIDALNEIGKQGDSVRDDFIRDLIKFVDLAPKWIRFIVTSRPEADIFLALHGFESFVLRPEDEKNLEDVKKLIEYQLSMRLMVEEEEDEDRVNEIVNVLVGKSGGNMLWAKLSCDIIADESFDTYQDVKVFIEDKVQGGIDNLFMSVLEKAFVDADAGVLRRYKTVMGVIVSLNDPLDQSGIADKAGLTIGETGGIVLRIKSLLCIRDGRVHVVHKSFKDFLTSSDRCTNPALYIDASNV
ncbi:hypothetical protein HDU76_005911 [Blyttiomyces sp. JEL0837]|nr:hypothetical protein HDU76_005911 [Blyttiomyces sp. JEL0837]